jgi:anti-sigma-K factor RskA
LSNGEHIRLEELELMTLGALPDDEAAAIKAHVAGCDVCTNALAQTRGNAAILAFASKQEQPAASVKAELMGRIRANREAESRAPSRAPGGEVDRAGEKPVPQKGGSWWNWVLVTAAVALALVSFGLSWQNRRIVAELEKQRKAAEGMIHEREQIEKLVSTLAAPDTVTVKLAGTDNAAKASGMVKFNAKEGVVLYSADLPALPADKSYQMWLVPANGEPISAGLLGPGGRAWGNLWTAQVPENVQAKAFAVTIEPVGGMSQPTGPKVLLGAI